MTDFIVGERVRVKPEFDELLALLKIPTQPGTVVSIQDDRVVVAEDAGGVEGGGTSAPYKTHELERI